MCYGPSMRSCVFQWVGSTQYEKCKFQKCEKNEMMKGKTTFIYLPFS